MGRRPPPMDADVAAKIAEHTVDVANEGDESPIGLIILIARDDHLLVENLAVEPAHQGRGVGRALLAHAEATAARRALPELRLYTNVVMTENLELYPRLGYRETERRTEHGLTRVFFSKRTPAA